MTKNRILTINQIIESENKFISKFSQEEILKIAGKQIADYLESNFHKYQIFFICGRGNNGNDGIEASKILTKKKIKNIVYEITKEKNDKKLNKFLNLLNKSNLIIDCIFGTGLNREVSGIEKQIIDKLNNSKKKIISIDIPSGVNGDNGIIGSSAVNSNFTLAMGFYKPAHFLLPSKKYCGKVNLLDLKLQVPKKSNPKISLINKSYFKNHIPEFGIDINKYDRGHVLILGGEMSGASRIVSIASRKIGSGLATIAVPEEYLKFYSGIEPGTILTIFKLDILKKKNVLVIGPGLGKTFDKNLLLNILNNFSGPVILDADAISVFKNYKKAFYNCIKKKKNVLLTPHKGEFERVFDNSSFNKIENTINASKKINNSIIFKGNDSVLVFPDNEVWLCDNSRNSLATAGTGDALCGIIAGLLAQKMKFKQAIVAGLWIHGQLSKSKKNIIVEDFLDFIPEILIPLKNSN